MNKVNAKYKDAVNYAAPMLEVVEIAAEQGFAASIENLGETKEDQEW